MFVRAGKQGKYAPHVNVAENKRSKKTMTTPNKDRAAFEAWYRNAILPCADKNIPANYTKEALEWTWQAACAEKDKVIAELVDCLKRCRDDYAGIIKVCRHYSLDASHKDAMESKAFIEQVLNKAQGE